MNTLTINVAATATAATTTTISPSAASVPLLAASGHSHRRSCFPIKHCVPCHRSFALLHVTNDPSKTEVSPDPRAGKSEADKIVDGMDFGELCNEFECISSPLVESTARQLVRDILELRQGNRALGTYATSVKYKDPVRSFTGREKYKRPLWVTDALDNTTVGVQEMVMMSTSVLNIKWTIKGKAKSILGMIGGYLIIKVNSKFTLNQISGQVIEHEESWDLSASSPISQSYFWASRSLFAAKESAKDVVDSVNDLTGKFSTPSQNVDIYPDPSGDPTKFFQRDDISEGLVPDCTTPCCCLLGCTVLEDNFVKLSCS